MMNFYRHVHSIELLDSEGNIYMINSNDLHYSYRKSNIDKKSSILGVTLIIKLRYLIEIYLIN
jgi:UDP-N-acetylenolpyruvoylglucosamine reductase